MSHTKLALQDEALEAPEQHAAYTVVCGVPCRVSDEALDAPARQAVTCGVCRTQHGFPSLIREVARAPR